MRSTTTKAAGGSIPRSVRSERRSRIPGKMILFGVVGLAGVAGGAYRIHEGSGPLTVRDLPARAMSVPAFARPGTSTAAVPANRYDPLMDPNFAFRTMPVAFVAPNTYDTLYD